MLKFGVMLRPGHFPFAHMLTCMRVAEDAGFEFMWFGDSHLIWHEVSPYLAAAAAAPPPPPRVRPLPRAGRGRHPAHGGTARVQSGHAPPDRHGQHDGDDRAALRR